MFNIVLKNCRGLFNDCKNITSIDLTCFDTDNVTNIINMFSGCKKLIKILIFPILKLPMSQI